MTYLQHDHLLNHGFSNGLNNPIYKQTAILKNPTYLVLTKICCIFVESATFFGVSV